jgi:flagellar motility protein MotE (MotC chaperone)
MSEGDAVFSQIVHLCDDLVNVVLDFPISARQSDELNDARKQESRGRFVDLLQWLHYEEWLTEQVKLYEAKRTVLKSHPGGAGAAADDGRHDVENDNANGAAGGGGREAQLFNDIVQLQEETFARASLLQGNRHLVKRILEAKTVFELAFRPVAGGGADDGDTVDMLPQTELDYAAVLLRESLHKQRELIALTAELQRVDAKIAEVEKKNAEWRRENRKIVERNMQYVFGGVATQARPPNAAQQLAAVNKQVDNCIVLRNVLKQLVFESGLNWSNDLHLRQAVLAPDEKREI